MTRQHAPVGKPPTGDAEDAREVLLQARLAATASIAPPMENGELLFEAPWEARAFGMAHRLCDAGLFEWDAFRDELIAVIATWDRAHPEAGNEDQGHEGPGAAAHDAPADDTRRDGARRDGASHPASDRFPDPPPVHASDRTTDRTTDRTADRTTDRTVDRTADQASEHAPYRYYEHWLLALERTLAAHGLTSESELTARVQKLAARPHGHDH